MNQDQPLFILVGHCGPDMHMLRTAIQRAVSEARIESINDADELHRALTAGAVLLVNRVLDGDFATESGIELIRQLQEVGPQPPKLILISNLADAQQQAAAVGALPGFGKSELYKDRTITILREAVGQGASSESRT